jgi:hypothetical protein
MVTANQDAIKIDQSYVEQLGFSRCEASKLYLHLIR